MLCFVILFQLTCCIKKSTIQTLTKTFMYTILMLIHETKQLFAVLNISYDAFF